MPLARKLGVPCPSRREVSWGNGHSKTSLGLRQPSLHLSCSQEASCTFPPRPVGNLVSQICLLSSLKSPYFPRCFSPNLGSYFPRRVCFDQGGLPISSEVSSLMWDISLGTMDCLT